MEKKETKLKEGKSKEESKKPPSKRDKYGGWTNEKGVYFNSQGQASSKPKSIPPDPERFKNHIELEDGSGIQTLDGKKFNFTENRGWYDEYFNYYNRNGEPEQSPSEQGSQSLDECKRRHLASEGQEADDEKDETYQDYSAYEEEKDEEERNYRYDKETSSKKMQILKKIDKLSQVIFNFKEFQDIKLALNRLPANLKEEELLDFIGKTVQEKINIKNVKIEPIIMHKHHYNRLYLTLDKDSAIKCLALEGQTLMDHPINLSIDPVELQEKDSSDDENDFFSSDHHMEKHSTEFLYNKADTKFKNGEEDFKITTEKKKQLAEPKNVISRHLPSAPKIPKEEKKNYN